MPFFCPYCGRDRPDEELTKEHVLPKALGGNLEPTNPFALDVCIACNIVCGRHVDAPFSRSWLVQMDRAANARRFVDLKQNPSLPLTYMGMPDGLQWEGKVCDLWFGPALDPVFHFHDRYPDTNDYRTEAGRPLHVKAKDIDPGFVVVLIAARNPAWWPCLLRSVIDQIDSAPVYVANAVQVPTLSPRFAKVPASLRPLMEQLRMRIGTQVQSNGAIAIDADDRFLAKLALGFGSLFLNPSFGTSVDATLLRNYLWERKSEGREALKLRGTSFFNNRFHRTPSDRLDELLGWKPGHVIVLQAFDQLLLSVIFYGSHSATIQVTADQEHWTGCFDKLEAPEGTVFVVAPGFRKFIGPVPLSRYIVANVELKRGNVVNEVGRFMHQVESHPEPPPFDLEPPA